MMPHEAYWTETRIVAAVLGFYHRTGRWPDQKHFVRTEGLPPRTVVNRRMGHWQDAVRRAKAQQW